MHYTEMLVLNVAKNVLNVYSKNIKYTMDRNIVMILSYDMQFPKA